jgi:hemin uptake protein HemP
MTKERGVQATAELTEGRKPIGEMIPTRTAQELLGERGILRIEHEGEVYTLRITRNNRLILTK